MTHDPYRNDSFKFATACGCRMSRWRLEFESVAPRRPNERRTYSSNLVFRTVLLQQLHGLRRYNVLVLDKLQKSRSKLRIWNPPLWIVAEVPQPAISNSLIYFAYNIPGTARMYMLHGRSGKIRFLLVVPTYRQYQEEVRGRTSQAFVHYLNSCMEYGVFEYKYLVLRTPRTVYTVCMYEVYRKYWNTEYCSIGTFIVLPFVHFTHITPTPSNCFIITI
jgi:hypothetical protein